MDTPRSLCLTQSSVKLTSTGNAITTPRSQVQDVPGVPVSKALGHSPGGQEMDE